MIWIIVGAGAAVIFLKQYLPGMDNLTKKQRTRILIRDVCSLIALVILLTLWAWYSGAL